MKIRAAYIAAATALSIAWSHTADAKISTAPLESWELEQLYDEIEYMLEREAGDFVLNYEDYDETSIGEELRRHLGISE